MMTRIIKIDFLYDLYPIIKKKLNLERNKCKKIIEPLNNLIKILALEKMHNYCYARF